MKILVATRSLQGVGGTRTFNYTLINELKRLGHDVEYFALHKGLASDKIKELGVKEMSGLNYDLILASLEPTIDALLKQNISGPIVQFCHSISSGGELPHHEARGWIAMSEEIRKHIKQVRNIDAPAILNGVDCNRFRPRRKIRKTPKVVAAIVQDLNVCKMIDQAAALCGMEVIRVNKYQDAVWDVEKVIDRADMVVSLGRGCYEAMACGRPVVIFDKGKRHPAQGDGYIFPDPDLFDKFARSNCNGRAMFLKFTVDELAAELKKYDREHGPLLREIALEKVNTEHQVEKILEYCQPIMENYNYPGNIDVVYPLGHGSKWQNNEIRYSIRSFKKHFKDLRNIVVVGEKPIWMKGVVHIPHPDAPGMNKDGKILKKITAACKDSRVSENFILCSDDTFINRDLSFDDFTGWHEGPIIYNAEKDYVDHRSFGNTKNERKPSHWFDFVYNTGRELKRRGLPDNNYDRAHCPQPINKTEFLEVIAQWDYVKNNYTCKNLYLNSSKIFTGENIAGRNLKVYNPVSTTVLNEALTDVWVWNIGNGVTQEIKETLQTLYADSSGYEFFSTGTARRFAAENWMKSGMDYEEGVAIFAANAPRNYRLIKWFQINKGRTIAERKLQKTMELWLR